MSVIFSIKKNNDVCYNITGDLVVTIFKGPIGVCVGIIYGFIAGIFLWYIPAKDCVSRSSLVKYFNYMYISCN